MLNAQQLNALTSPTHAFKRAVNAQLSICSAGLGCWDKLTRLATKQLNSQASKQASNQPTHQATIETNQATIQQTKQLPTNQLTIQTDHPMLIFFCWAGLGTPEWAGLGCHRDWARLTRSDHHNQPKITTTTNGKMLCAQYSSTKYSESCVKNASEAENKNCKHTTLSFNLILLIV